tara:strand:+ start:279 stop:806 length:528 start_codon:yes stop_codon:yes gene_type:complete
MKSIEFKNKHQKDSIKKACDYKSISLRENMIDFPDYIFENTFQTNFLNRVFLEQINNDDIDIYKLFNSEINRKINSYINQDIQKGLINNNLLNKDDLLEKIIISKLRCNFCNNKVKLFYKEVRDKKQWTLDRIDNNLPHTITNVSICCLECNIKRRNRNYDKFLFSKQIKLEKIK